MNDLQSLFMWLATDGARGSASVSVSASASASASASVSVSVSASVSASVSVSVSASVGVGVGVGARAYRPSRISSSNSWSSFESSALSNRSGRRSRVRRSDSLRRHRAIAA